MSGSDSRTDDADELVRRMNERLSPSELTLGARVLELDRERGRIVMSFEAVPDFCHSRVIVQGGFITGMLDSAMAEAVIGLVGFDTAVPTLELKVSFISPGNPGQLTATAWPVHLGKSTAFLAAELHQAGRLVATASSTAKLVRRR